ncbi:MAG: diguanylate cyclase, partial [Gammaproteobacteria bacterium]|nr:diguanylate cyclase [Gammaproteobacteria bacterium]
MSQEETTENQPHVLVVDDSRLMRVAVKKILKKDYRLTEAEDGEEGWDKLSKDDSIQVVISDLSMPNMDGFGLLEKIRTSSDARIKDIPVIIITGVEDDDITRTRALDCGASDFVTKPFDSVQLLARTKAHAQHGQTSRKLTEVSSELEKNTIIDPLTGLANKRHFMTKGAECTAFSKRHNAPVSILRLDIDKFESFFVKFGRHAADAAIKSIASILLSSLRKEDAAARIGLAKFALILVNSNPLGVSNLAKRIQSEIGELGFGFKESPVRLTVSIGISSTEVMSDNDFEKLIDMVEEQLAIAHNKGGNTIEFAKDGIAETTPSAVSQSEDPVPVQTDEIVSDEPPDLETAVVMATDKNQQETLVPHIKIIL